MRFTAEQKFERSEYVRNVEKFGLATFEKILSDDLLRGIVDLMSSSGKFMLFRENEQHTVKYYISSTILTESDVYEIKSAIKSVESYLRKHLCESEPAILELHAMWHLITKGDTKPFSFDKSKSYFSFAKFLSDNFEYHDNLVSGDEYVRNGQFFTEKEVFGLWRKSNLRNA